MRGNASGALVSLVYGKAGGSTLPAKLIYANAAATLVYSTPTGTLSGGGASSASGASSSGRAQVNATATPAGNHSGVLSYAWQNGGVLNYLNTTSATITAYHDFTGVPNGGSASLGPDTGLYCLITDLVTGAQYPTAPITVGPLTWTNTIPAYGPFTAGSSGGSSSGSVSGGSAINYHDIVDVTATAGVVSGGPVSGSYSYNWFVEVGATGATLSNTNLATCNVHFDWHIPAATSDSLSISLGCTVTDLVSGFSSTAHSISVTRFFDNNTG